MTGASFRQASGMAALENSFPNVEFVYPDGGFPGTGSNRLWVPDPPGGKGEPTSNPNVAAASMQVLDNIVQNQGPFFGILGYSQGSMFVTAYLSHAPAGTFQTALMFAGYTPTTHTGLLNAINTAAPFNDIPAMVWMGEQDFIVSNAQTNSQAALFTNPTVLSSAQGGHSVPSGDSTYAQVVEFIQFHINNAGTPTSPPTGTPLPTVPTSPTMPTASPTIPPTKKSSATSSFSNSNVVCNVASFAVGAILLNFI